MACAFITYITLKGFKKIWPSIVDILSFLPDTKKPTFFIASLIGLSIAFVVYFIVKSIVEKNSKKLENTRIGVNTLFTVPLIFAAALLSFAHGANDVANAIGPLAAINDAIIHGGISVKAGIPLWVMAVGAIGIALGLALYGPKLIRTVGSEITELDQIRAFSVAMAAAITVIIASQLGLPVSSTHIAVGGIFGVGFLREYLSQINKGESLLQEQELLQNEKKTLKAYLSELETLEKKESKKKSDYERIVELYKRIDSEEEKVKEVKKQIKNTEKIQYVKRDAVKKIIAAWIITVPAAALLSAMVYFMIRGIVL